MEKIITNEYIQYKAGFLDGKSAILKELLNSEKNILEELDIDSWYAKGYLDGYEFYKNDFLKLQKIDEKKYHGPFVNTLLEKCFQLRVVDQNQKNGNVPIGKFRL